MLSSQPPLRVVGGSVGTGASVGASVATTSVGASVTCGASVATFPPPQAARTMLAIMSKVKTDIKRLRDIFLLQKYGYSDVSSLHIVNSILCERATSSLLFHR